MRKPRSLPIALTIAGSDSGGGAGIQADLKTFASLGVHGTSVITCITAQNPRRVLGVQPCSEVIVRQQLEAVFAELPPMAAKTGMLYSTGIIRAVADFMRQRGRPPLIVDPVMVATSGASLLKPSAIQALADELLPLAALITPNVAEAERLAGRRLRTVEDLRAAARGLHNRFSCAVLVKGGHLRGLKEAADIFYDGKEELLLSAPFIPGLHTHGTGCTYSASITAFLAKRIPLTRAVQEAKGYITRGIARSATAAGHFVMGWGREEDTNSTN